MFNVFKMMTLNIVGILRVVQLLFAFIILVLSAYVANWYNMDTHTASPSQVNLLIAAPVISFVSIAYTEGSSRFAPRYYHAYAAIALDAVNCLLYFSGFIALAVFLNSLLFCRGNVCGSARAATAFAAIDFGTWAASAGLIAWSTFRGGARKASNPKAMYAAEMKDISQTA